MSQKAQKDPLNETVFPTPYFGFSAPFCVQVMSPCGTDRQTVRDGRTRSVTWPTGTAAPNCSNTKNF